MFFAFVLLVVAANAQRGRVQTLVVDTLKGNNSSVMATIPVAGTYDQLYISVLTDKISSAAGGTLYLQAGMDASSALEINATNSPSVEFMANDTNTIVDGAYWNINVTEPGARYYYIYGDGDVNDTVQITTRILLK